MCMTCGCKQFDEDHGDTRNLTMSDFRDAAEAAGTDVQQVAKNVADGFKSGGSQAGGQYTGAGTGQPSRGSGGFDDPHSGSFTETTATEKSMTGAQGTQYETGREGDYEKSGTSSRGKQTDTSGRGSQRGRITGNK